MWYLENDVVWSSLYQESAGMSTEDCRRLIKPSLRYGSGTGRLPTCSYVGLSTASIGRIRWKGMSRCRFAVYRLARTQGQQYRCFWVPNNLPPQFMMGKNHCVLWSCPFNHARCTSRCTIPLSIYIAKWNCSRKNKSITSTGWWLLLCPPLRNLHVTASTKYGVVSRSWMYRDWDPLRI